MVGNTIDTGFQNIRDLINRYKHAKANQYETIRKIQDEINKIRYTRWLNDQYTNKN